MPQNHTLAVDNGSLYVTAIVSDALRDEVSKAGKLLNFVIARLC